MEARPDYGLDRFDRLLGVLNQIYDPYTREDVRSELLEAGSAPDIDELSRVHGLEPPIRAALGALAGSGRTGPPGQPVGSVLLAAIRAESHFGSFGYGVHLFARHRRPEEPLDESDPGAPIVYEVVDEAGESQEIATSELPLSLREMIDLVDAFLRANSPASLGGDDWRDDHFGADPKMRVDVRSPLYPELERWYRESIEEWFRAHPARS